MTETAAAINERLAAHRRAINEQKITVIPAKFSAIERAKDDYDAGLLSANSTELAALKAAVGATQDNLETEQHRLSAMERLEVKLVADEKAARAREATPGYLAACLKYVDCCRDFHDEVACLGVALRGADEAIAEINKARNAGVQLPVDMMDLNPRNLWPGQPHPAPRRVLMTADAAAGLLGVEQ